MTRAHFQRQVIEQLEPCTKLDVLDLHSNRVREPARARLLRSDMPSPPESPDRQRAGACPEPTDPDRSAPSAIAPSAS
jgi:hypothetical protein